MSRPLLIYDGRSGLFRRTAALLGRCAGDAIPVAWESDAAQRFLEAQFGGRPFAFVLVEGDAVHVGDAAVERLLERANVSAPVARAVTRAYPAAAPAIGRVVHGREPADIHGTFELAESAGTHLSGLREYAIPVDGE